MALFQYRALQSDGMMVEGVLEAGGRQEACRQLEGRGLNPVNVEDKGTTSAGTARQGDTFRLPWSSKKVPYAALEAFTRQLSNLLKAGVPLSRTLNLLSREASSPVAREQWKAVHELVIDGTSLAGAMGQFPQTFPRVYVAMVQAGETGGFLEVVLAQISEFQSREKDMRGKVMAALIYPIILVVLSVAVIIFLMLFFIPKFKDMFAEFGASLPALTQFVMGMSELLKVYAPFGLVFAVLGVYALKRWVATEAGRRKWEQIVLNIPAIGGLAARFSVTRFCRMLGTLIGSGVPLMNALRVARESLGNQILVDAVSVSIDRVQQGDRLADSLKGCRDLFPSTVLEMISVSEETGNLDEELVRMAETMDAELDRSLRTTVSLAEPLLLVVMAGFIGLIVVSMVLPIFTLQEYIK